LLLSSFHTDPHIYSHAYTLNVSKNVKYVLKSYNSIMNITLRTSTNDSKPDPVIHFNAYHLILHRGSHHSCTHTHTQYMWPKQGKPGP